MTCGKLDEGYNSQEHSNIVEYVHLCICVIVFTNNRLICLYACYDLPNIYNYDTILILKLD